MTDVVNMCILQCQFQMSSILTVFLVSIQRNGFHWDFFFSHMDIDTLSLAILLLGCAPNSCSPLAGLLHSTTLPFCFHETHILLLSLVHLYLFPLDRLLFFHSSICMHECILFFSLFFLPFEKTWNICHPVLFLLHNDPLSCRYHNAILYYGWIKLFCVCELNFLYPVVSS